MSVTLGELTAEAGREPQVDQDKIGLSMQTLNPEVARLLGLDPNTKGAVVTVLLPNSRAAKSCLRREDVIIEVER
jgi:S1-C subfamily serine protease